MGVGAFLEVKMDELSLLDSGIVRDAHGEESESVVGSSIRLQLFKLQHFFFKVGVVVGSDPDGGIIFFWRSTDI